MNLPRWQAGIEVNPEDRFSNPVNPGSKRDTYQSLNCMNYSSTLKGVLLLEKEKTEEVVIGATMYE